MKADQISIKEKNDARWTKEIIDHSRKYGVNEYALSDNQQELNGLLDEQMDKIDKGNPDNLIDEKRKFFEILLDNKIVVGNIIIFEIDKKTCELEIAIFDKYSGKGYAKQATQQIIDWFKISEYDDLEIIVRLKNLNRGKIIKLLQSLGFKSKNKDSFNTVWFLKK